jgi:hypothetical protein
MGPGQPPQVADASGTTHQLSVSRVRFVHDGTTHDATITLDWVPAPSGVAWIPVGVAAFVAAFAAAFARQRLRVVAALVTMLVLLDASHTIAYELVRPGTTFGKVWQFFENGFVSVLVWIAAIPTVVALWRRRVEGLYGAIFVALMVALVGGASDASVLWHSQLPSAGPDVVTRLEVVLALGLGGGVALGALTRVIVFERARPPDHAPPPAGAGRWLANVVVGLNDDELRRITADLDVDEVLETALDDLARRMQPNCEALGDGALVLHVVADDDTHRHPWSLYAATPQPAPGATPDSDCVVVAERGAHEPVRTEVAVAFPLLLQLLAGTVSIDDGMRTNRVTVRGDEALLRGAIFGVATSR